ncbi:MAG: aspartate dehydrogenase domain-containing protein [Candidatus Omnitrophota bacterium]
MKKTRIGILGCGAIGEGVALFIEKHLATHAILWGVSDRDTEKAEHLLGRLSSTARIFDADALARNVDLIIETASVEAAREILAKALRYRKDVVILSVGALVGNRDLLRAAQKRSSKIYIPSGAICGVDGLGALSLGNIRRITLTTSKPPRGLAGARYLTEKKINLSNLKSEKLIFQGSVNEAIKYFPQNINVAATLFLAASLNSHGKVREKNIKVAIKADPAVSANVHHIVIEAEETSVEIIIKNVPSKINPKTSALAILSTQSLLKKMFSPFKVGS